MDVKNLKRDMKKIESGDWVSDIPGMGDVELFVRGSGYKVYLAKLQRYTRAAPQDPDSRNRDGSLKPEAQIQAMARAMAEELLLNWRNITDNGKPVEYDDELALEWMTNPETRSFLDAVVYAANVVELGREEVEKAILGN